MTVTELKTNLHKLIDSSQDEELLSVVHDILEQREVSKPGDLWNSLTEEEKEELLNAEKESQNPSNLIAHDEVMKKYKK